MKKLLWISLAVIIAGIGIYVLVCNYTYSKGTRTGYLIKFSDRGYIFKTYEGELNLGGLTTQGTSVANYLWDFSVLSNSKGVIDSLKMLEGSVIRVGYKQKIKNLPWQGETPYFVYSVTSIRK